MKVMIKFNIFELEQALGKNFFLNNFNFLDQI